MMMMADKIFKAQLIHNVFYQLRMAVKTWPVAPLLSTPPQPQLLSTPPAAHYGAFSS